MNAPANVDEKARVEVDRLLKRASDSKLLHGGTPMALEILRKAYERAEDLPAPWPQICAYRLAHLLMRSERPDLEEIDQLFDEAGRARSLDPWPKIFRLAVLCRSGADDRERKEAFDSAIDAYKRWLPDRDREDGAHELRLQDEAFNLLELACYFMGEDHSRINGLGTPIETDVGGGYFLVTRDPQTARVRYTYELASEECGDRAKAQPNAFVFELARGRARWKYGAKWKRANEHYVRLVAYLARGFGDRPDLDELVYGEVGEEQRDTHKDAVRQFSQGLRNRGIRIFKKGSLEALDGPVIGVVRAQMLESEPETRVTRRSRPRS